MKDHSGLRRTKRLARRQSAALVLAGAALGLACSGSAPAEPRRHASGLFELSRDVGDVGAAGDLVHEGGASYRVSGSGSDVWWDRDAFHFAARAQRGDVQLQARIEWTSESSEVYRKALLMLRDGFEPDAAYADVAVHGGGLAALQYRPYAGAPTLQLISSLRDPRYARLERHGQQITGFFSLDGRDWVPVGPVPVALPDSVQAGIGTCSHDAGELATARFAQLELRPL